MEGATKRTILRILFALMLVFILSTIPMPSTPALAGAVNGTPTSAGTTIRDNVSSIGVKPDVAPVVNLGAGTTINAGDTLSSCGSFIDADSTSWTAAVDYGDGSGAAALVLNADNSFNLSRVYATAGSYMVTVTVIDNQGTAGSATTSVVVNAIPRVWTDKSDYYPRETVHVTANGFRPNEPGLRPSPTGGSRSAATWIECRSG